MLPEPSIKKAKSIRRWHAETETKKMKINVSYIGGCNPCENLPRLEIQLTMIVTSTVRLTNESLINSITGFVFPFQ